MGQVTAQESDAAANAAAGIAGVKRVVKVFDISSTADKIQSSSSTGTSSASNTNTSVGSTDSSASSSGTQTFPLAN
jgi:hypothetical protein